MGVLVSDWEKEIFNYVNCAAIASVISLFGVVANVMNMVVFYKQGFASNVNISFFALAISDLCSLITMLFCGLLTNPLFIHSDIPMVFADVFYIAAASPHCIFGRITGWITVYITAERCLCIALPLKIKQIVTPTTTTVTVCLIFLLNVASFMPEFLTAYLQWKFYPESNRTLIGMAFSDSRKHVEGLLFILYSILGFALFIVVIVFTVVLVAQLKQKSKWRREANADKTKHDTTSTRDKKTMKMVVMIATVLIVCYIPGVVASIVTLTIPDMKLGDVNINAFHAMWSFVYIFDVINSSVNIFLYHRMSNKFRQTFNEVFGQCKRS